MKSTRNDVDEHRQLAVKTAEGGTGMSNLRSWLKSMQALWDNL
jgi:hypothetical protein